MAAAFKAGFEDKQEKSGKLHRGFTYVLPLDFFENL
jgi:hypothetical protein